MSTHDSFSGHGTVRTSSNRSFGFTIAGVLAVVGLVPLFGGGPVRLWAVTLAAVLAALAAAVPGTLTVPNRLWTRFGLLLARIVNPIVMTVLFLLLFAPLAIVMRLAGRDALRLRMSPGASTYWQTRQPHEASGTFRQQF